MDLILWRHAQAADTGADGGDFSRPLTPRGREQARAMARWLDDALPRDAVVLTSPALRAVQTVQALPRKHRVVDVISPALGAVEHVLKAAGWGRDDTAQSTVVIVGHQPVLGEVAATLMCGQPQPWHVKKGAVWWLKSRGEGCELWAVRAP